MLKKLTSPAMLLTVFLALPGLHAQQALPFTSLSAYVGNLKSKIPGSGSAAFVPPSDTQRAAFAQAVRCLLAGIPASAAGLLDTANYDLYLLNDARYGKSYWVLQERSTNFRGLGTYIFDPGAARNLVLEVPHPLYDTNTPEESQKIFQEVSARALFIAGTHRCANTAPSPCSGTTTACNGIDQPYRISDSAHFDGNFIQAAHQAVIEFRPQPLVISVHGQSSEPVDVELSDGTRVASPDTSLVNRLRLALQAQGIPAASCNRAADNPQSLSLCGTDNVQGRLSNGSPAPCGQAAAAASGFFLHMEQKLNVRNDPSSLIAALKATIDPLPPPVIRLERMSAGPLSNPVFVGNARDGSNRLFIVERDGRIKILQPGASATTTFLDISSRLIAGGERGLLGLTFHPGYRTNRRFFVNYTRKPDGATVVAEYRASPSDADLADPAETVFLVVAQPYANHNGGMIAFGPDGHLYIGMGDGGSGNDPQNYAQNSEELLGKILRIDVDHPESAQKPYSSPPDNPFFGPVAGRDEIFALGVRNPWRFSFDRLSGQLWAGDVGQNQIEEADVITLGANLGWRVYEGTRCTNLGPASCTPGNYAVPVFQYSQSGDRCSITGGYAYRGSRWTLPPGAYLYGDYCTGEILLWYGNQQHLLLDAPVAISSFGEDESGELYVVGLDGTLDRVVNDAPLQRSLYLPLLYAAGAATPLSEEGEYSSLALANYTGQPATLRLTAYDQAGVPLSGNNLVNPVLLAIAPFAQYARMGYEIFGAGLGTLRSPAWVLVESSQRDVAGLFLVSNREVTAMDGAELASGTLNRLVIPGLEPAGSARIHLANPGNAAVVATLDLVGMDGNRRATSERSIPPSGFLAALLSEVFAGVPLRSTDYLRVSSGRGLASFLLRSSPGKAVGHAAFAGITGLDASAGGTALFCPQFVTGESWRSAVSLINLEDGPATVILQQFGEDGSLLGLARQVTIPAQGMFLLDDPGFFGSPPGVDGYLRIASTGARLTGSVTFGDAPGELMAATLPLQIRLQRSLVLSQIASSSLYYTGLALLNPGTQNCDVAFSAYASDGRLLARGSQSLLPGQKQARVLTELLPELAGQSVNSGYLLISATQDIAAFALFGTHLGDVLTAIPAQ